MRTVGIDFGTSTTLIADRLPNGEPTVLPIGLTTPWMPSVVGVDTSGNLVAGEAAFDLPAESIVRSTKSRLTSGQDVVMIGEKKFEIGELIQAILREALGRATKVRQQLLIGSKVFIGCPALWTGPQRRILADAFMALDIDIDIADIVDEPVAAGLFFGHSRWLSSGRRPSGKTLVFDAGGGTLDIALMEIAGDASPSFTVLAADGRPESGDALDVSIAELLHPEIVGLPNPRRAEALLALRSTALKERLSSETKVSLALGGDYSTILTLNRHQLEVAFTPQMTRASRLVESAIRSSQLRVAQPLSPTEIRATSFDELAKDIHHLALVGGLSQVPMISEELGMRFPNAAVEVLNRPQEAVVAGLTYGDQVVQLNLPRPPVNFVIEYSKESGEPLDAKFDRWAQEARLAYSAYTPLYSSDQIVRGETHLGHLYEIPYPSGCNGRLVVTLRCEAPDRAHTRLLFRLPSGPVVHGEPTSGGVAEGIRVTVDGHQGARFKLMTNGDLSLNGSRGERLKFKIQDWPNMRGPKHDWSREIRMQKVSDEAWISQHAVDNWRYQ